MAMKAARTIPGGTTSVDPPLSFEDGLRLYESPDIFTLGEMANAVRERRHGRNAFYNINLHINYSNYCVLRCKFCSFYRPYPKGDPSIERQRGEETTPYGEPDIRKNDARNRPSTTANRRSKIENQQFAGPVAHAPGSDTSLPNAPGSDTPLPAGRGPDGDSARDQARGSHGDEEGGYELTIDEIVRRARVAYGRGATEVHIVGGLHPKLPFSYYTDMCAALREACPHLHIKAFTAIEIIHFTRIAKPRLTIAEVLTKLREAGLGSMPGGGAEIFDDRVHDEAFKTKVGEAEWFEVHRTAHELGIFTNATMLYGHVETPAERIKHLIKLREHQEESLRSRAAHFNCVIPLSFIPDGSALSNLPGPSGLDDLKTLAISRLMCHNIPHIKAFWIMQTPKLAQVALNWGVDDLDGTVVWYDITRREGNGTTHQELTVDKLRRLIVEAGCQPVERDTLYRRVIRSANEWHVEGENWRIRYDAAAPDERWGARREFVELGR